MAARWTALMVGVALVAGLTPATATASPTSSTAPPAADPNAYAPSSFAVGADPKGIAVVSAELPIPGFVTNSGDGTVTVFTPCQPKSCAPGPWNRLEVGKAPTDVVANSDASVAYVSLSGSDAVAVITGAATASTVTVAGTIAVGSRPTGMAIDAQGARVYVANNGGNSVSVIDTASRAVVATVPVGPQPWGIAVSPSGTTAYVANNGGGSVSVIDTATSTVVATIPVGAAPADLALDPSGTTLIVTNNGGNSVSVVDTASRAVVATVPVGRQPWGVAVTADGAHAFVANYADGTVSAIRLANRKVIATIRVGANPFAMTAWPSSVGSGSAAYVTNAGSASVSTIPLMAGTPYVTWSSRGHTARGVVPFVAGVEFGIRAVSKSKTRTGTCRQVRSSARVACSVRLPKGTWRVSVTTRLPWQLTAGGNQNRKFHI
jgi:YVTN family beta-propeller protein